MGEETTAGTLSYMPPEVLTGEDIKSHPAIDIWALGILLYQLLFGALPFEAPTTSKIRNAIIKNKIKFPGDIEVSEEVK